MTTETVYIDTLDQFVRALHQWHHNKVQLLKHMTSIPEGTEVNHQVEGSEVLSKIEGDFRSGFILGLEIALTEMGELPFEAEVDFNTDQPAILDSAAASH